MAVIWRRPRERTNPEHVFERVREVEVNLRAALKDFRSHLEELETEIGQQHGRQDREEV